MRFFCDPNPIQRNYLSDEFLCEPSRFIPARSVHFQVGVAEQDSVKESRWLEKHSDFPNANVALTDLSAVDLAQRLDRQQAFSKLRGICQIIGRHLKEDARHGTNELLDNPDWLSGLKVLAARGLSFDLQMIPPQMPAVLALLKQVPYLKVALCHCGSPRDQTIEGLAS
jgi:predicted TIM-barrel fold metal-dependent hydrolase